MGNKKQKRKLHHIPAHPKRVLHHLGERPQLPTKRVPTPVDDKRGIPTGLARGGLFYPFNEAHRISEPIERIVQGRRVLLDVYLLTPAHAQLLVGILKLMEACNNTTFRTTVYQLCRAAGFDTNKRSYENVKRLLRELGKGYYELWHGESKWLFGHILSGAGGDDDTGEIGLIVNGIFLKAFIAGHYTRLNSGVLARLRGQVAPLLYLYYASQKPYYSGQKYVIRDAKLRVVLGFDVVAEFKGLERKAVTRMLKRGHRQLVRLGFMEKYTYTKGKKAGERLWTVWPVVQPVEAKRLGLNKERMYIRDTLSPLARTLADAYYGEGWPMGNSPNKAKGFEQAAAYVREFVDANYTKLTGAEHRIGMFYSMDQKRVAYARFAGLVIMALKEGKNPPQHVGYLVQRRFWESELPSFLIRRGTIVGPNGPNW